MKPADDIQQFFRKATLDTDRRTDERVREMVWAAHEEITDNHSASIRLSFRSMTMRNPMAKLSLAAAVIAVVVLGAFQFVGDGPTSGVVWAQVPENVAQATGNTRRIRETWTDLTDGTVEHRYKVFYWSPEHGSRMDYYEDNRIVRQWFICVATQRHISLDHKYRRYSLHDYEPKPLSWDVQKWMDRYLAGGGTSLGRRQINGRWAEGIEVTAANPGQEEALGRLDLFRLWVDVESGLPVQQEDEATVSNGKAHCYAIEDRWLWDVAFDPNEFVPHIPAGYRLDQDYRKVSEPPQD